MTVWMHTRRGRIEGVLVAETDSALHIRLTTDSRVDEPGARPALAGTVLPLRREHLTEIIRPTIAQLLDFAAAHPGPHTSRTDTDIREQLRITPTRYIQLLIDAITTPEALQHDPVTTNRLLREQAASAATRARRIHP